jgi:EAL domain-containing protein (putative c-di-GMP-specific phosphodiesterase class I)
MVRAIVGLANEFDLITTAEGVEDEPTLCRLRELGVHRAQGYHVGRPNRSVDPPDQRTNPRAGSKLHQESWCSRLLPIPP